MRTTSTFVVVFLSILFITHCAYAHTSPIHQDMADLAMICAEREQGSWLPSTYRNLILDGSWQEDYLPPYYVSLGPIANGAKTSFHGYNPITDSTGGIFSLGGPATDYALILWDTMADHFEYGQIESGHDPWDSEDLSAYHWLGRTCHMVQDMTTHPHIHPQNITAWEHSAFEDWEETTFHGNLDSYLDWTSSPLEPADGLPSEATSKLDAWSRQRLESETFSNNDVSSFIKVVARITYFRTTFWGEVEFIEDTWGGSSGDATQPYTRQATFGDGTVPGSTYPNTLRTMFGAGNVRYVNSWTDDYFEITDANGQGHTWKGIGDDEWFPCANPSAGTRRDGSLTTGGSDPTDEGVRTVGRFHFSRADQVRPVNYPDGSSFDFSVLGYSYTKYAWQAGLRYNAGLILVANRPLAVSSSPGSTSIDLSWSDNLGNQAGTTGTAGFARYFVSGETVTLTADATDAGGRSFEEWLKNGLYYSSSRSIAVTVTDAVEYTATYREPFCGNGTCDPDEDSCNCCEDCGAVCGDGCCNCGETCASCPGDCCRVYVDCEASGANDGLSWEDAYTDLQDALDDVGEGGAGVEIWVAECTYTPDRGTGDRVVAFELLDGVGVYGGFEGADSITYPGGETERAQRDWVANVTTLSGDIGVLGNASDNSYHVVLGGGTDVSTVLDGFTITAGNADGPTPDSWGGGMYNADGSPTVANCTFHDNSAAATGGGMHNRSGSAPTLTNCTFSGNYSVQTGGGMFNNGSSPVLTDCTFSQNSTDGNGGGMLNGYGSNPQLTGCTFSGNTASAGGAVNNYNSTPVFTNCTLDNNSANFGGGLANAGSNPTLTNCTLSNNSATGTNANHGGGGMYNRQSAPTLTDCEFTGNEAANLGGAVRNQGSNPEMTGCTFSGNSANAGGGVYNNHSNPVLNDCAFTANSVTGNGGGMLNSYDSGPGLTGCTFSGNTASAGGAVYNYNSTPAFTDCTLEQNSANFGGGIVNARSDAVLTSCTLSNNSATGASANHGGGGMYNWQSTPTLTNCEFNGNEAVHLGGAMRNQASAPTISGCAFIGNSANAAGGIYNNHSSPNLAGCNFVENSAAGNGGGMLNSYESSPTLTACTFNGNEAEVGGGMFNYQGNPALVNCLLTANSADFYGGGMHNVGSEPTITNCTFVANYSALDGKALSCNSQALPSTVYITNCIVWDCPDWIWNNDGSTIIITYSDICDGWPGEGNINGDPMLVPPEWCPDAGSPCIDAGNNNADTDANTPGVQPLPGTDLYGNPRFVDDPATPDTGNGTSPIVDMGVCEYQGS